MDILKYSKNLLLKDGIWYIKQSTPISYPDDGNEDCYQIEEKSFWFRHRNNCIIALVKKFHNSGTFFDVGGGNGFVTKGIEDAGIETILLEPGEKGCLNAKKRKINNVICATLKDSGFETATIDAVGVFDVVEHIENDTEFLATIHKYLKKDGLLFVSVPAYRFLWSKDDDYAGHFNRYTTGSLSKKLKSVGFSISYATYIFSILPIPIFFFRTLAGKLGLTKDPSDTAKHTSDHQRESPLLKRIWNWELGRIKNGEVMPFGGSVLLVARKL